MELAPLAPPAPLAVMPRVAPVRLLAVLLPFATGGGATGPVAVPEPMTARQKRLLAVLGVAIGFWATDQLHGISPAWVALGAAVVALWPGAGLLDKDAMKTGIDLSPNLHPVAAVDEDAGLIRRDDGKARAAGEAGQPGKTGVRLGDIFALMRVGAWDDEGVEVQRLHLRPQVGQAQGVVAAAGRIFEALQVHSRIASMTCGSITATPGRASISTCADCSSAGNVL